MPAPRGAVGVLGPPSRRNPVGHAGVTGAVGEAGDRVIAAKGKIRGLRIADRPVAFALCDLEQRAALRAVDGRRLGGGVAGNAGRLRADQAQ